MSDPEIYLEKDRLSQRLLADCLIFRHDYTLQRAEKRTFHQVFFFEDRQNPFHPGVE